MFIILLYIFYNARIVQSTFLFISHAVRGFGFILGSDTSTINEFKYDFVFQKKKKEKNPCS